MCKFLLTEVKDAVNSSGLEDKIKDKAMEVRGRHGGGPITWRAL